MQDLGSSKAAAMQPSRVTTIDTASALHPRKWHSVKPHTLAAAAAQSSGQCVQHVMPLRLSNRWQLPLQPQKLLQPQQFDCSCKAGRSAVPATAPAAPCHHQPGSRQQADDCRRMQQEQEGPASARSCGADTAPHLEGRQAAFLLFQERRRRRAEAAAVIQAHVRWVGGRWFPAGGEILGG